ncbi:MAG: site-specific integrase [Methylophilaceae bacterium]
MQAAAGHALLAKYLQAGLATNTKTAYQSDLAHFKQWGGSIPASPEMVATYLASFADSLSPSTLTRRLVAINQAHTQLNHISPTKHAMVKATLQGIKRINGSAQRKVLPLFKRDLEAMLDGLRGVKGCRDKALLLIGFAGAFRRSELVSIQASDIRFVAEGLVIRLRRSKTDQAGAGQDIAIPYVKGKYCPVKALKRWLHAGAITQGPVFPSVNRYGQVMSRALTPQSVALIIKHYAALAGLDVSLLSGHSLRVGLVTNAARVGAHSRKIRQQTRHQSDAMLQLYIRDSELFIDHPVQAIWSG